MSVFQGVILKITDEGRCIVGRILHGGMMHKLGLCNSCAVFMIHIDCCHISHVWYSHFFVLD